MTLVPRRLYCNEVAGQRKKTKNAPVNFAKSASTHISHQMTTQDDNSRVAERIFIKSDTGNITNVCRHVTVLVKSGQQ